MDSGGLSSNWKKLQERLRLEKDNSKRGAKRKAEGSPLSKNNSKKPDVKHRMTAVFSNGSSNKVNGDRGQSFDTTDILGRSFSKRPSDANLPEALTAPTVVRATDELNGGRTPGLEPGKYVALDCEMVGVGPHPETSSALARASVVDYHGTQLYDSFVLPKEPITDFRTPVSGITPALLKNARSFDTVQHDISELLKGRILIGHAVRNDLSALMLGHPKAEIRDTSYHGPYRGLVNGAKPALRFLASEVLGLEIQSGSHSSVEDARATMALFRRDKATFESEAAGGGATAKQKAAINSSRGTKRTGAKSKKRKNKKK